MGLKPSRTLNVEALLRARVVGYCTWCGRKVPKGKRYWCSQKCVDEYLVRKDPSYARRPVERRDKGVCSKCGTDTWRVQKRINQCRRRIRLKDWSKYKRRVSKLTRWDGNRSSQWDMDHVCEVRDGGGSCGLDNLQTLCIPCHKEKTRLRSTKSRRKLKKSRPKR